MTYNFRQSAPAAVALADALPQLRAAETALASAAYREGIVYLIAPFGGTRTEAITREILGYRNEDYAVYLSKCNAAGREPVDIATFRPVAEWQHSYHDFGAAFDVMLDPVRCSLVPGVTWKAATARLGALGPSCGLRWGGNFAKPDAPHFELRISLGEALAAWDAHQRTMEASGTPPTNGSGSMADTPPATDNRTTKPGTTPP